ncbi:S41 family peptidase [Winogradskyella immobilis]|uniref:Tricorn protease homolog n=1 Tax=Winogradskyella immobilis TaxID=2816852 RepID=A0ABS8EMW9_9FLAO|nr:S41 family peptidase [Winogradskyella immobilis]MCC1484207.1 PDZ domain-containing protein [Winogradskyella immobilis]MCG0016299.1 PDZ domain-containing protein [Winogradskyella immobilis]
MKRQFIVTLALCYTLCGFSQGTQLLRQPTIHGNDIVFVYANDLWKASINGGTAIRLTSDDGYESSPHFSNDGKTIAFTAQYDGNVDVYTIPSEGGEPKRLTYHPGGDFVQGWTPDGEILFRSGRESQPTMTSKFFTVSAKGGLPVALDIPRAAYGEISADGKHIAYTPITGWDAEWRNYRGGQAMPIWIVDLKTKELTRTTQPTKERHLDPIWLNGIVYFISERDYTANIWSFNPNTKEEKQITFHKKFDVKSLDASKDAIAYEQGGYLHVYKPNTGDTKQLNITVKGDLNFSRVRWENISGRNLSNPNVSPKGKRAVFEHRGEIFTVPKENGTWRNLTNSPGVADRNPIWSPKGDKIAWFSDKSGEYQLVIANQDGSNLQSIKLPNPTFYFVPDWSSDGKHIAYTDTHFNIWIANLETKKVTKVATDSYAHPNRSMNPVWSPDSKWIAYAKQQKSHFKAIFAYNIETKKTIQLTDPIADAITPVWDANGKYLYTLASTDYGLASGWLDMSSYDPQTTRSLYAVVLNSKDKAPNLPKTDEEEIESDKKEDKKEAVTVTIDENGIYDRAVALRLPARNYTSLLKGPKHKVFIAEAIPNQPGFKVHSYDVTKQKATDYAKGVFQMVASNDRNSILLNQGQSWNLVSSKSPPKPGSGGLNTNMKIKLDPKAEAHQIFKEGWRYMRDFLYVDNVHGAPWDDIYKWYSPWVNHVRHRTDLNYVVDIMSGEVAIGHSYVSGGDLPDLDFVPVGLLGTDLVLNNGNYQIAKIFNGERWNPNINSPLGKPGINVNEGDYLLAINGKSLDANTNPYQLLEQTAGREITITVNSTPSKTGARTVLIQPVGSERGLRTIDWVENNRRKVDELSNGKLAYVYVPNTSPAGFTSFNRYYFSQQDKKGVVIDERNNGGGSAADYMIDIMSRELFGYFNSKANDNRPWTTPMAGIWGPKVMLINERAGSGGDLLPYMFKAKKIGPLIGTRTWGGLVGTWDTPRFIDGGRMVAPRGGFFDVNGEWAVEGEGIAPNIEVIQEPKYTSKGIDPQLERGVKEALKLLETQEFKLKPEPKAPIRWKRPKDYKSDN